MLIDNIHSKLTRVLQKAVGRTIRSALLTSDDRSPKQQLFLYFEDGTHLEIYSDEAMYGYGDVVQGELKEEIEVQKRSNRRFCAITKEETAVDTPSNTSSVEEKGSSSVESSETCKQDRPDKMEAGYNVEADDYGLQTLERILLRLQADDQWLLKEDRGFRWWGHHLEQHVWCEPCYEEDIESEKWKIWSLCAETSIL